MIDGGTFENVFGIFEEFFWGFFYIFFLMETKSNVMIANFRNFEFIFREKKIKTD